MSVILSSIHIDIPIMSSFVVGLLSYVDPCMSHVVSPAFNHDDSYISCYLETC